MMERFQELYSIPDDNEEFRSALIEAKPRVEHQLTIASRFISATNAFQRARGECGSLDCSPVMARAAT